MDSYEMWLVRTAELWIETTLGAATAFELWIDKPSDLWTWFAYAVNVPVADMYP